MATWTGVFFVEFFGISNVWGLSRGTSQRLLSLTTEFRSLALHWDDSQLSALLSMVHVELRIVTTVDQHAALRSLKVALHSARNL